MDTCSPKFDILRKQLETCNDPQRREEIKRLLQIDQLSQAVEISHITIEEKTDARYYENLQSYVLNSHQPMEIDEPDMPPPEDFPEVFEFPQVVPEAVKEPSIATAETKSCLKAMLWIDIDYPHNRVVNLIDEYNEYLEENGLIDEWDYERMQNEPSSDN